MLTLLDSLVAVSFQNVPFNSEFIPFFQDFLITEVDIALSYMLKSEMSYFHRQSIRIRTVALFDRPGISICHAARCIC